MFAQPVARSLAGADPVVPSSTTMFTLVASANSPCAQVAAFSPSLMKSEPMKVLYRLGSESTERSVSTTGIPAAFASSRTASQPVSTTGEKAIRSTPWVMKVLIDEICLAWSPSAEVNCRSTPYFSAVALMLSVFALRQPLSDPTWANPMTAPFSTAGSTAGSSPPAASDAPLDAAPLAAAVLDAAALVLLSLDDDDAVLAPLLHAASANAAAAAAARTASFLVTTNIPPTLDEPCRKVLDRRCKGCRA